MAEELDGLEGIGDLDDEFGDQLDSFMDSEGGDDGDFGGGWLDDGAGFIPSPDLPRPRGVYYGHMWTGPPIRDPRAKNFLPAERYPLPLYAPYAHGAAYALSADYVNFIVQNHVRVICLVFPYCSDCSS